MFDGRYVYLVPNSAATVARFDTQSTLDAGWSTYDLTPLGAASMWGGAFDGRYVYFVPSPGGTAARYNPAGALNAAASWATFDMATSIDSRAKGFRSAAFDGRYVYFVPYVSTVVVRYDTLAPSFSQLGAWSSFDMAPVDLPITGFEGAVFDGRYVYFVPNDNGVVARFDALPPPATPLPPDGAAHGSFF